MRRILLASLCMLMAVGTAEAEVPIKIAAVPEGTIKVALRQDAKELRRGFRLVAHGVPSVKVQEVRLAACTDGDGQACKDASVVGACAAGCEVTATQPGDVTVVLPTPAAGVYTASLEIVYVASAKDLGGGKVEVTAAILATALEVTRAAAPVGAVDVLAGPRGDEVERLPGKDATATFRFPLQSADGRPYDLDALVLGPVVRKSGTDELQSAATVRAVYVTADGKRTEVPTGGQVPKTALALHVEVGGIDRAGKFEGKLRLLSANRTPQEVTYTITARDGLWTAALWILAGVLISYGIQWWVGRRRGRLVQQRTVLRLRERVSGRPPGGDRDRRLREALIAECDARLDDLDEADLAAADLTRLARRIDLAGTLADADRSVERLPVPARLEPRKKLDTHAAILAKRTATDEQLTAIEDDLATLATVGVRRAALDELLTALDAAVAQARTALPASLQTRLTERVESALRDALRASDAGDLDALDGALAAGRRELAKAQGAALGERFPEAMPAPFTDAAAYDALRKRVLGLLQPLERSDDPDEAVRLHDDAHAIAAPALCSATAAYCRTPPPGAPEGVVAHLEQLAAEAMAARTRPAAEAMATADRVLRQAEAVMAGLVLERTSAGPPTTRDPRPPLPPIPNLGEILRGERPSARATTSALAIGDGAVLLGLIVIALATGLRLLWAGSATWGGWNDWLTALLWGGGLHAVGNDSFKGLLGLKKDLGKTE